MSAAIAPNRAATLPFLYPPLVALGAAGFVALLVGLAGLYAWFAWTGITSVIRPNPDFPTMDLRSGILRTAVGILFLLLMVRILRTRRRWPGARLGTANSPDIETVVADCARRAGVSPPEAVLITPDTNIAAYSSGLVGTNLGETNFFSIGALLLTFLSRADLEAAILHEFAHLAMRRDRRSVALDNRMRDFVLRFRDANRAGASIFVLLIRVPIAVLWVYWRAYSLGMAWAQRREEFRADRFAADLTSAEGYAYRLTRILVLQEMLAPLADRVNGAFHAALLGMSRSLDDIKAGDEIKAGAVTPNWFAVAREVVREAAIFDHPGGVLDRLRAEEQTLFSDHPPLLRRLAVLGGELPSSAETLALDREGERNDEWERAISLDIARTMRPELFAAKVRAGIAPDAGFTADSVVPYRCCVSARWCAVHGQEEVTLTGPALRWRFKDGEANWAWHDLAACEVERNPRGPGMHGWWIKRVFAIWLGHSSIAELRLTARVKGGYSSRKLLLFHLGPNVPEATAIIEAAWRRGGGGPTIQERLVQAGL